MPVQGVTAPMPDELPPTLDFDLDLGLPEEPAPAQEAAAVTASTQDAVVGAAAAADTQDEYDSMKTLVVAPREARDGVPDEDVDIELEATDIGFRVPSSVAEPAPVAAGGSRDFDLDLSSAAEQAPASAEDVATIELERTDAKGGKPLDFNFEFGSETLPGRPPALNQTRPTAAPVDLSMINLDLGEAPATPPSAAASQSGPAAVTAAAAIEEVATKLELAHAYEEMGDKEGARELLQEVINEGDAAQQASARTKLAQLA